MRLVQSKQQRNAWIVAAVFDLLSIALIFGLILALATIAKADYVLAFHGDGCWACQQMAPVESLLKSRGLDLRIVNAQSWPEGKRFYKIRRWPTYVLVHEQDGKQYDTGKRVGYPATAEQIKSMADGLHSVLKKDAK